MSLPNKTDQIRVRVTPSARIEMDRYAKKAGCSNMSDYISALHSEHVKKTDLEERIITSLRDQATRTRAVLQGQKVLYAAMTALISLALPKEKQVKLSDEIERQLTGVSGEHYASLVEERASKASA